MAAPNSVHDPQVLRAIAHPVRNRILGELAARGSLRAADVARDLAIPANQASFHLRQLAKYGLVEEDPDAARDKRDRVWKVVHAGGLSIDLADMERAPGGRAAADVFRRNAASWGHLVVDSIYAAEREPGVHSNLNETTLRLSSAESRRLAGELSDLVDRYRAAGQADAGAEGDDQRRTYLYFGALLPHPARLGRTGTSTGTITGSSAGDDA